MFLDDQLKTDRSIVDLLTADYTFLNEQLAWHYGVQALRKPLPAGRARTRIAGVCWARRAFWQ